MEGKYTAPPPPATDSADRETGAGPAPPEACSDSLADSAASSSDSTDCGNVRAGKRRPGSRQKKLNPARLDSAPPAAPRHRAHDPDSSQ